jgi:hypothetical protein
MPHCKVSRDLKARIPYLAYVEGFKVKEIGRLLGSDVQGFQKPQGFYPGVWRVGVRVQIFRPFKNPYPSEGSEGTDID